MPKKDTQWYFFYNNARRIQLNYDRNVQRVIFKILTSIWLFFFGIFLAYFWHILS